MPPVCSIDFYVCPEKLLADGSKESRENLFLLIIRGVVTALTLRLLFQIFFVLRQLVIAPLEEKGGW